MKNLLKMSLASMKNLSRTEMKNIMAGSGNDEGGTCCARANGYETWCGLSIESAKAYASGGGNWCCDSCGSASWV
ncbi:hypothetical protein [Flavobacterium bizetiae]|uniref:hypothetical protein n=1 Tax=Flavobacterium bizetiae TaxID=2704140 RepID=UPI00375834E0